MLSEESHEFLYIILYMDHNHEYIYIAVNKRKFKIDTL